MKTCDKVIEILKKFAVSPIEGHTEEYQNQITSELKQLLPIQLDNQSLEEEVEHRDHWKKVAQRKTKNIVIEDYLDMREILASTTKALADIMNSQPTESSEENVSKVHDIDEFYKDEEFSPVDLTNVEPDRIKTPPTEDKETKLLDAINRGLRKWGFKEKLSSDDSFDLLFALQEELVGLEPI